MGFVLADESLFTDKLTRTFSRETVSFPQGDNSKQTSKFSSRFHIIHLETIRMLTLPMHEQHDYSGIINGLMFIIFWIPLFDRNDIVSDVKTSQKHILI